MFWNKPKNRPFVDVIIHIIDTYRTQCGPYQDGHFIVGGIILRDYSTPGMDTSHSTGNKTVEITLHFHEKINIRKAIARWMAWRVKQEILICEGNIESVDSIFQPNEDR